MMTRIEEIDQEMHDLKIVLRSAEARIPAIYERMEQLTEELDRLNVQAELSPLRTAESFTVEEKCAIFNRLHEECLNYVHRFLTDGYCSMDVETHFFNTSLSMLLSDNVWSIFEKRRK